jgi:hypothetical protein
MKQIVHIFAKDVRHLWKEILVSIVLITAFALIEPTAWWAPYWGNSSPRQYLVGVLMILVIVGWWLLIARLVHEENLVGDRQFWLTRPYNRKSLIAAKVLFLFCFLYLPLFIAQAGLLARAGFNPFSYVSGLAYGLLLISAVLVLPAMAIASVTSNLVRMTVTILGVCLILIAFTATWSALSWRGLIHDRVSIPDFVSFPILVPITCIVVVLMQYMDRRLAVSRITLSILLPAILLYALIFASDPIVNLAYRSLSVNQSAPIALSLSGDVTTSGSAHETLNPGEVEVAIPIRISGTFEDVVSLIDGVRVDVRGQNIEWHSRWQGLSHSNWEGVSARGYSANQEALVRFLIDRKTFEHLQAIPTTLHLTFAVTQAKQVAVQTVPVSMSDFAVPDVGVCSPLLIPRNYKPQTVQGVLCREAFREPELTLVETSWTQGTCANPTSTLKSAGWIGSIKAAPAELGISPVSERLLNLSNGQLWVTRDKFTRQLCPGTPLKFTQYHALQRFQTDVTVQNFRFPAYDTRIDLPIAAK